MSPNLTTSYAALQIERDRLPSLASRGWEAEEAVGRASQVSMLTTVRRSIGTVLVTLGKRLQRGSDTIVPTGIAASVESTG